MSTQTGFETELKPNLEPVVVLKLVLKSKFETRTAALDTGLKAVQSMTPTAKRL